MTIRILITLVCHLARTKERSALP